MRQLTDEEITILEDNSCWAEDWDRIMVDEDFRPNYFHRVMFYGDIELGTFDRSIEVSRGFMKHSGINNATLRNVKIGDNCLIENIGNYINNYTIGDDCYISNVCMLETTEGATYGEGNLISVLNEMGEGNLISFRDLNSQLAAFMVKHMHDKELKDCVRRLINENIYSNQPDRGTLGNNVKIVNTKEITNTIIEDDCEISGTSRLSDCTILSNGTANVFIGTGVICENTIISYGSSVINSAKLQDCFVGEACQIANGFTAVASVFFANSYMSNGEACAAFCGPFTTSHHKSNLLIGSQFSFYNAGCATHFGNHAYKMGALHYATLERGCKMASGANLLMPAHIGSFSVCFGNLKCHPNTRNLPFSYLTADGNTMHLAPGYNIATASLYRDIRKWPKRDVRPKGCQKSIVNFDWLSPFSVGEIVEGKRILEKLREACGNNVSAYNYHEYIINASALSNGIKYYDIALRIYIGSVLKRILQWGAFNTPTSTIGLGKWNDLSGLLLPESEEKRLIEDIKDGQIDTIEDILHRFEQINSHYHDYQWTWTYQLILDYYHLDEISEEDITRIHNDYINARRTWVAEIREDAEREYGMGDVEPAVLDDFMESLDHETDFEN